MTEAEWLACDDSRRMSYSRVKASDRKWRLVVCACNRRIWDLMEDARSRQAVEMSERIADGLRPLRLLDPVAKAAENAWNEISRKYEDGAERAAAAAAFYASNARLQPNDVSNAMGAVLEAVSNTEDAEKQAQVSIIRDIFGNPFRPVTVDPSWLTSDVVQLARGVYDERAFDRMPILADALQDAGCDNADVLGHCRDPNGVHVRGCWVVDLLLGKS